MINVIRQTFDKGAALADKSMFNPGVLFVDDTKAEENGRAAAMFMNGTGFLEVTWSVSRKGWLGKTGTHSQVTSSEALGTDFETAVKWAVNKITELRWG